MHPRRHMKTNRYHLSQDQKSTLKGKIKQVLDDHCKEADAVYLFGSFAGNARFSDIDIGLLLKEIPSDPTEYELKLEVNLERQIGYPFDIRILNTAPPGFCYDAIAAKQLLVDRDPDRRADFEGYMLKKHFDFQYYRKRYLSEVLNAPL
jgi:hypothetical protein